MRKAAGIALTALGAIWFALYGFLMLRLSLPAVIFRHVGNFGLYVDPVAAPISGAVFIILGVGLLSYKPKAPSTGA